MDRSLQKLTFEAYSIVALTTRVAYIRKGMVGGGRKYRGDISFV